MPLEDKREHRRSLRRRRQHEALLRADLSLLDATADTKVTQTSLSFMGQTLDISAEGMGLILPHVTIDERFIAQEERTLSLILDLPAGPVQLEIAPVRLVRLDEKNPHLGYLVGAQITRVDESGQDCFSEYLRKA